MSRTTSPSPPAQYQAPVPTRLNNSLNRQYGYPGLKLALPQEGPRSPNSHTPTSQFSHDEDSPIAPLAELIDDCFKVAMGRPVLCPIRTDLVAKFERYVREIHCQENLLFLIEIYKYEYYFDRVCPAGAAGLRLNSPSSVTYSNSFLNRSLGPSIETINKKIDSLAVVRSPSKPLSVRSDDLVPTLVFVSTIDDLGDEPSSHQITSYSNNVWDNLRENAVLDDDDLSDHDSDGALDRSSLDYANLVAHQWTLIMNNYIRQDAPDQINISNKASRDILTEDLNEKRALHSPIVLLRAKNEIMQLIKENAYISFVKQCRTNLELPPAAASSRATTPPIGPKPVPSPNSEPIESSPSSLHYGYTPPISSPTPVGAQTAKTLSMPVSPVASPALASAKTSVHLSSSSKKKSRFLHKPGTSHTPGSDPTLENFASPASVTSLSTLLSHFKLSNTLHNSPSNTSSSGHSLSASVSQKNADEDLDSMPLRPSSVFSPSSSKFGKIWKSKKHP